MTNNLKFRSGQVQLHKLRVDSNTVISAGDLLYLDGNDVKPASEFPWDTDLETTQAAFADVFIGVSHQSSADGDTDDISVDLSPLAIYQFEVAPGTYEVGDLLAPAGLSSQLMSQQLEAVIDATQAIAFAAEYQTNAETQLRASFASAYHSASANANAAVG